MAQFSCKFDSSFVCDVTPASHIDTNNSYCPICVHFGQPDAEGMVFLPFFGFCSKEDDEVVQATALEAELDYYFSFEKPISELLEVTHPDGSKSMETVPF